MSSSNEAEGKAERRGVNPMKRAANSTWPIDCGVCTATMDMDTGTWTGTRTHTHARTHASLKSREREE